LPKSSVFQTLGKSLGNAYDLIYIIYQLEDLQDMPLELFGKKVLSRIREN
jgi:hypothetical protein